MGRLVRYHSITMAVTVMYVFPYARKVMRDVCCVCVGVSGRIGSMFLLFGFFFHVTTSHHVLMETATLKNIVFCFTETFEKLLRYLKLLICP
jgi:hypothetical protein